MDAQTYSPILRKSGGGGPATLDFPDAIRKVIDGKKITRLGWNNENTHGVLENGLLVIKNETGTHSWLISDGDLLATDWIVVVTPSKIIN